MVESFIIRGFSGAFSVPVAIGEEVEPGNNEDRRDHQDEDATTHRALRFFR